MILYYYIWQNDHPNKSSYHLSSYKDVAILFTTFPMLYISSQWLICFVTGSLYLLISLTYFTHWVPSVITSCLKSGRGRQKKRIRGSRDHRRLFREMHCWLWRWREETTLQGMQLSARGCKRQGNGISPRVSRKERELLTFWV